jgi:hypothetical protein
MAILSLVGGAQNHYRRLSFGSACGLLHGALPMDRARGRLAIYPASVRRHAAGNDADQGRHQNIFEHTAVRQLIEQVQLDGVFFV